MILFFLFKSILILYILRYKFSNKVVNNSLGIIQIIFLILIKVLFTFKRKGIHINKNPKATTIINIIFNNKFIELYFENTCSN